MTVAVTAANEYLEVVLSGTTRTRFKELKSTPELGQSADKIDATHLESEMKEYIKDIPDFSSDLEFTMNAMPKGEDNSNLAIVLGMDQDATYKFYYGMPQLGIEYEITGQWTYKIGAGEVSSVKDLVITIIPNAAPTESDITSEASAASVEDAVSDEATIEDLTAGE